MVSTRLFALITTACSLFGLKSGAHAFSAQPLAKMSHTAFALHRCQHRRSATRMGSTTNASDTSEVVKERPHVQRHYETFEWTHNANKYKINYRVEGPPDGTPILLVHGFGANVNHFRYQFPDLVKEGYRVYAVDLLGFGASDKPKDEAYCIELFTELIVDFCKAMNASKQWVVAGNSIGGLCSLAAAKELGSLVQGVVLFNCSGGMTGFRYNDVSLLLRPVLYFVQHVVLGPGFGGRFFENFKTRENVESILRQQGVYGDTTNVDEELIEILLGPSRDDGAQEVFLKVFAGPPGPTPESLLPDIKVPILALWGDADPWTPLDAGAHPGTSFSQFTDKYTLVALPGAGHCPHDECPDRVNSEMIAWLAELGTSKE